MEKVISLFFTVFIIIFSSCNKPKKQYVDVPQIIIVAGKIDNYETNRKLTLHVNRPGFSQEQILAKTDSTGNFIATFESYIPVDVWVMYNTNFLALLHPCDSLFIQFDGKYNDRPELLESISFGGSAAIKNQNAAKIQQMYYSNEIYYDWDKKNKAIKEYEITQYIQHLDTVQFKLNEIYERFIVENNPDKISRKWALLFIENYFYFRLGMYAYTKQYYTDGAKNVYIPKGSYDRLCNRLPIDTSMFINSDALCDFSGVFRIYVIDNLRDKETDSVWHVIPGFDVIEGTAAISDSIRIFSTIEFVRDPLLLQIMLTEIFDQKFESQDISVYERFQDVANTYIKEPFLREPLQQKYLQTKQRIENPQIYTEAILKEAANLSVNQIMDDILQQNKGKVIYVDFWGTWCGHCLSEMPSSKIVEHENKNEDVVFVYICLESEEKQWKLLLDKFQLGGQHYLLSQKQSSEIRKLLSITGVPFYLLVDKNWVIREKGSHLRPSSLDVREKIKEMLK
jgi:thiol-disulfide isomerase/thioredoxin